LHLNYYRQLPTSLEELLEYQWEQGAQFLMQQASQYDGTVSILHSNYHTFVAHVGSKNIVAHRENISYLIIVCFTIHRCCKEKSGFGHSLY